MDAGHSYKYTMCVAPTKEKVNLIETFTPIFIEYWPDWGPSSRQYNIIYNILLHPAALIQYALKSAGFV